MLVGPYPALLWPILVSSFSKLLLRLLVLGVFGLSGVAPSSGFFLFSLGLVVVLVSVVLGDLIARVGDPLIVASVRVSLGPACDGLVLLLGPSSWGSSSCPGPPRPLSVCLFLGLCMLFVLTSSQAPLKRVGFMSGCIFDYYYKTLGENRGCSTNTADHYLIK